MISARRVVGTPTGMMWIAVGTAASIVGKKQTAADEDNLVG